MIQREVVVHVHGYGNDHELPLLQLFLLTLSFLLLFDLIFICFCKSWQVLHSFHL